MGTPEGVVKAVCRSRECSRAGFKTFSCHSRSAGETLRPFTSLRKSVCGWFSFAIPLIPSHQARIVNEGLRWFAGLKNKASQHLQWFRGRIMLLIFVG